MPDERKPFVLTMTPGGAIDFDALAEQAMAALGDDVRLQANMNWYRERAMKVVSEATLKLKTTKRTR